MAGQIEVLSQVLSTQMEGFHHAISVPGSSFYRLLVACFVIVGFFFFSLFNCCFIISLFGCLVFLCVVGILVPRSFVGVVCGRGFAAYCLMS